MWQARSSGAAALVAVGLVACGDDEQRYELDGLTVVEGFDEPICAGTFDFLERRLTALERMTGLPRDPLGLVYHWVYEHDELGADCQEGTGGCSTGRDFYGELSVFSHELAHSHLTRLGHPRVWLREGMARMLEDSFSGEPDPDVTPSDLLQVEDSRGLNYTVAGKFTAYLRDRFGMPQLLEYYEASDEADVDNSVVIFEEVFGEEFQTVEADYLSSDKSNVVGVLDCDVEDIGWSGETWSHSFSLSCDDPSSVGLQQPLDEPERPLLWAGVTMTVLAGWFAFDLDASAPAWVSVLRCDQPASVYLSADETHADAYLEEGRYLIVADAYSDAGATAVIKVRRLGEAPGLATTHGAFPLVP